MRTRVVIIREWIIQQKSWNATCFFKKKARMKRYFVDTREKSVYNKNITEKDDEPGCMNKNGNWMLFFAVVLVCFHQMYHLVLAGQCTYLFRIGTQIIHAFNCCFEPFLHEIPIRYRKQLEKQSVYVCFFFSISISCSCLYVYTYIYIYLFKRNAEMPQWPGPGLNSTVLPYWNQFRICWMSGWCGSCDFSNCYRVRTLIMVNYGV